MTINRRDFISHTTVVAAATALMPRHLLASTLVRNAKGPRTIIGYCWPQTVRPGESLDAMVSTYAKGSYQADLVRIICADNLTDPSLYKEEELKAPFAGEYAGRHQPIHLGSYVEINAHKALNSISSFTVQAKLYPTFLPGTESSPRASSQTYIAGEQYLISRWDKQKNIGWALMLDSQGQLTFVLGDGVQVHRTTLSKPLINKQWFSVVASFDAKARRIRIMAEVIADSPADKVAWPRQEVEDDAPKSVKLIHRGPLRFAACTDGPGNGARLKPGGCFNGKLDRVRITADALSDQQAATLTGIKIPKKLAKKLIGFWDFGKGIDTVGISDLSRNKLNGVAVNVPTRAITGVDWDGTEDDWRQRPAHYSAIYFHEDDLYDAEWQADFSYQIPKDLRSSIYAIRLRQGDSEDYIPFFVAPPKNQATAPVALLLPTATYTAYTNFELYRKTIPQQAADGSERFQKLEKDSFWPITRHSAEDAYFMQNHMPELGKGVYHFHPDGSYYETSSQKHPNMLVKPKSIDWTLVPDTYITDWLEAVGIDYDIITDDLLQQEGIDLLKHYRVVMTGNHPEYVSPEMLDALTQYQDMGGRFMYLGGNGFFMVTGFHRQLPGMIEVRRNGHHGAENYELKHHEMRHASDGVNGGKWKDNARPSSRYVGLEWSWATLKKSDPYQRQPDSYNARAAFIFAGVKNDTFGDYGLMGNGASGSEYDQINYDLGTPVHTLHLARGLNREATESDDCIYKGHEHGADMVFFEVPKGGAVFSVGSMAWVGALSHNGYNNDVARITENVLRRFLDKSPLTMP